MFKKELLIPALLGLGLFAQNGELNLCSNTTILLILFVLLEDHQEVEELECRLNRLERREICEECSHRGRNNCFDFADNCRYEKNFCNCGCRNTCC